MNALSRRIATAVVGWLALLVTSSVTLAAAPSMLVPVAVPSLAGAGADAGPRLAVRFNAAQLLALSPGEEVELTLPNGRKHAFVLQLTQAHGEGIYSWVGRHKERGTDFRAIVTTGPNGSYAVFSTPDGEYRLVPGSGHDWLVDMTAEQARMPIIELGGGHALVPPATKSKAFATGAPETMIAIPGVNTVAAPKVTPTPQNVIDLMLVYSRGYGLRLGGNMMTRLHFLVTRANTAYADSEVAITLRLVNVTPVDYPEDIDDTTALHAMTPGHPSFNASVFGGIEAIRNQYGADMVAFMRPGADFGGNGAAWIGTSTPDPNFAYAVASGCMMGCEWVFIHELGHAMGNRHDRPSQAWEAGGTASPPQGAFPYSYAHYYCASGTLTCNSSLPNGSAGACGLNQRPECSTSNAANFTTIMGLMHDSTSKVYRFSNPALSCTTGSGSPQPCGVASGPNMANDALSLNNNRAALSAMKATVTPSSPPGSVQFTATAYAATESAGSVTFVVGRTGGSTGAISVAYATSSGTATSGTDFTSTSGTLNWGNGDVGNKTITVPIASDGVAENNETFRIALTNPTGPAGVFIGGPNVATGIIMSPWPTGGSLPAGFVTSGGANAWTVGSDQALEGATSLRSAQVVSSDPTNSTTVNSDLSWTGTLQAGDVAFAYRVSSFPNAGKFELLLDGVVVFSDPGTTASSWKLVSLPVTAGSHTLVWRFSNFLATPCNSPTWNPAPPDGPNCADRAWIDGLSLPMAGTPPPATAAVISDLSGEGRSDLVFQNTNGTIAAWLMNGTSQTASANLVGAGQGWTVTHTGDLNGDRKADILLQHTDGRVYLYLMDGLTVLGGKNLLGAGQGWIVSKVADVSGDGKADLILRHTDGRSHLWLMDGLNTIGSAGLQGAGSPWTVIHTGDFNADGRADIVWQHTDGRAYIYLMNGTTVAGGSEILAPASGWIVSHVADLNGDGRSDLIFRHTDGRAHMFLMNGTTFGTGGQALGAGSGWTVTHVGDFDGDGKADLVFRHNDGRAHVRLMNGVSTVAGTDILPAASGWNVSHLYDLNGDGKRDLVFRHANGNITVRLMNGLTATASANLVGAGTWTVAPQQP